MIRNIYMHGSLADAFTAEPIRVDVNDTFQLVCALKSRFPKFRTYIRDNPNQAIILSDADSKNAYGIEQGMETMGYGSSEEVHIVPVQEGAGIEVAVAVFGMTAGTFAAIAVNAIAGLLLSMALGAIVQSLAPTPQAQATEKRPEEQPSFLYNGPENVQEQGFPVPVVYGIHMTGSVVVSAGISIEQLLTTPSRSAPPANGGGDVQPASPPFPVWGWGG